MIKKCNIKFNYNICPSKENRKKVKNIHMSIKFSAITHTILSHP